MLKQLTIKDNGLYTEGRQTEEGINLSQNIIHKKEDILTDQRTESDV
jgi:hypothetical protein